MHYNRPEADGRLAGEGPRVGEGSKAIWGMSQGRTGKVRGCFEEGPGVFRGRLGPFGEGPIFTSGPSSAKMALRPLEGIISGEGLDSFFGPSPNGRHTFPKAP